MVSRDPINMVHWIKFAWGPRSPFNSCWGHMFLVVHIAGPPVAGVALSLRAKVALLPAGGSAGMEKEEEEEEEVCSRSLSS